MKAILLGVLLAALWSIAAAQAVVGSSTVNGRPVEILSDRSWRYNAQGPSDCRAITARISFCGEQTGWTLTDAADDVTKFNYNDTGFGEFIVSPAGARQGISLDYMRKVVLWQASVISHVPENAIPIIEVRPSRPGARQAETLVYKITLSGVDFMFYDTVVIGDSNTTQVITCSISGAISDYTRRLHDGFLAATFEK
jgi:hypothetical protein